MLLFLTNEQSMFFLEKMSVGVIIVSIFLIISYIAFCFYDEIKRKKQFGSHYDEDRFLEINDNNNILVSQDEKKQNELPEFIRYKGIDIATGKIAYLEGFRTNDKVIFEKKEYKILSKENNLTKDDAIMKKDEFIDCKLIIEITEVKETFYLFCTN